MVSSAARSLLPVALSAILLVVWPVHAQRAHNMRLVGSHDLQARSAYQPIIQRQAVNGVERWIAYIGHHDGSALNRLTGAVEPNGVSIVDVTDPQRPTYLHHLPAVAGAQMVRVCSGDVLPGGTAGRTYLLRSNGNLEHQVFDVTDPTRPALVSTPVTDLAGTHKSYWECDTGIAYLVSGAPGWRTNRMTQIFDLSNPANPEFIRNFGLDGQQPGATGPVPRGLHGCISTHQLGRERLYCGHGTNSHGLVVILDRRELLNPSVPLADPANPTSAELNAPLISRLNTSSFNGAHTAFPVLGVEIAEFAKDAGGRLRDLVVVVNESIRSRCGEARQLVFLVDVTDETNPWPIASFNVRAAEGDYCSVGGRFGAHASNESFASVYYRKLVFISWFNAGVRAVDIRDPFDPQEAAYYVPRTTANTERRPGGIAIQTNNVEVDDRGLIYITDRASTGLHILELTGSAKKIADLP